MWLTSETGSSILLANIWITRSGFTTERQNLNAGTLWQESKVPNSSKSGVVISLTPDGRHVLSNFTLRSARDITLSWLSWEKFRLLFYHFYFFGSSWSACWLAWSFFLYWLGQIRWHIWKHWRNCSSFKITIFKKFWCWIICWKILTFCDKAGWSEMFTAKSWMNWWLLVCSRNCIFPPLEFIFFIRTLVEWNSRLFWSCSIATFTPWSHTLHHF